jgi:hypothetical protein
MNEVKWITPEGCSFRLTGKHFTHELKREMFERTSADKSYTLSLWFKAKNRHNFPIMASGYGVKNEDNANQKLFIGVLPPLGAEKVGSPVVMQPEHLAQEVPHRSQVTRAGAAYDVVSLDFVHTAMSSFVCPAPSFPPGPAGKDTLPCGCPPQDGPR